MARNDQIYDRNIIEKQLGDVIQQSSRPVAPVGILTSLDRDSWFKSYDLMMKGIVDRT